MADDSIVKIMQALDLNYGPAILSTQHFEKAIQALNQQLQGMKGIATQAAKDINATFSQQLGSVAGNKTILDQYGKPLTTIQTEAKKAATNLSSMSTSAKSASNIAATSMNAATTAAQQHGQAIQDVAKQYNVFGNEMQRRTSWFLTGAMFYGGVNAAKEAVQTISEVEMGMVEIARVMEDSTFVFKDYRDEILQLGVDYGFTFDTVQDIALRWAQAGYKVADSMELTKTSLLALNTAELDATNATESMVGIMAQWNLEAEDLMLVIDKINKTADDYTVTSQDLVDGLLRSSSAARIMNLSLDETIALLTVMREASGRTGREVGNALNSIISYIQRPGSINVLESMGIQVFADEARTQFRNVMGIFQDVAAKWNTTSEAIRDGFVAAADDAGLFNEELATALGMQEQWNDLQQRDIAQASAGVYRRNYYIGMIERLATAQEVLNNMTDAAGYSMRENERTMDTLAKKYESLKTAAQQLAVALGDAGLLDILKGLTDTATNFASSLSKISPEMKALLTTAIELLAVTQGIKAIGSLFGVNATLGGAVAALPGWTKLIPIILSAAGAVALYAQNAKAANDESLINSSKRIASQLQETDTVEKLIGRYEDLSTKVSLTEDEQQELKAIVNDLAQIYPHLTAAINDTTGALDYQIDAIKRLNETQKQALISQTQVNIAKSQAEIRQYGDDIEVVAALVTESIDYANRLDEIQKFGKAAIDNPFDDRPKIPTPSEFYERHRELLDQIMIKQHFEKFTRDSLDQIIIEYSSRANELMQKRIELESNVELLQKLQSGDFDFDVPNTSGGITPGSGSSSGDGGFSATLSDPSKLRALLNANKISLQTYYNSLLKIRKDQYSEFINKSYTELNNMLSNPVTAEKAKAFLSLEQEINQTKERIDKDTKGLAEAANAALQAELKELDHKKRINQLSTEQEIAELQRLQAEFSMNADERMNIIERLYSAEKSLMDQRETQEKQFADLQKQLISDWTSYYKDELKDMQSSIKQAYEEQIGLIEEKAKLDKRVHDDRIKQIDDELKALNRSEQEYDYNQKMKDLREQEEYWSVRTGENARKNLADIREQISEAEHDREIELQKNALQDEKETLQDKIKAIEDATKAEVEKWKKAYANIEDAFDSHSLDIIASAGAMAEGAFEQWVDKYYNPLMKLLGEGSVDSIAGKASGIKANAYIEEMKQLASTIIGFKRQYEVDGNTFAHQQAKLYYQKLSDINPSLAGQLQNMNYNQAMDFYEKHLSHLHTGGMTLSYGAAYVKPGELMFPPDLSSIMLDLISFLKTSSVKPHSIMTDTNRQINLNGPLLNIEKNYNEDHADIEIWAREIQRQIKAIR